MNNVKEKLDSILKQKDKKDHVYNFVKEVDYRVSSGSLKLDIEMEGGLGPGLARFPVARNQERLLVRLLSQRIIKKQSKTVLLYILKPKGD